jgi:hypothetical protein
MARRGRGQPRARGTPSSPIHLGNSEGCSSHVVHLQLQLQLLIARNELLHLNLPHVLQLDLATAQQLQLVIARNMLLRLELQV